MVLSAVDYYMDMSDHMMMRICEPDPNGTTTADAMTSASDYSGTHGIYFGLGVCGWVHLLGSLFLHRLPRVLRTKAVGSYAYR